MNRRNFLQTAAVTAAYGADLTRAPARAQPAAPPRRADIPGFSAGRPVRGVNLGGWLLLEKWITPGLFTGRKAPDEFRFGAEKGGPERLRSHRETFLREEDFRWIAARGLDAVRIPVGYWILEGDASFIAAPDILDRAFAWAKTHRLGILLDLHGAPGSQNGRDHSGHDGEMRWQSEPRNIARTVDVLESFARRYGHHPNLIGIEALNEPDIKTPLPLLREFSQMAYRRIRPHTAPEVSVVIHDAFLPLDWSGFTVAPDQNVVLDTHLYQCYSDADRARTLNQHIVKAAVDRTERLSRMEKQLPTIVGEWSLCLRGKALEDVDAFQLDAGRRAYAAAQLLSYDRTRGWFFWTYKTESRPDWSLRESIERGWMPESYRTA
jgi:glucan 1,3-beta-glucosidase